MKNIGNCKCSVCDKELDSEDILPSTYKTATKEQVFCIEKVIINIGNYSFIPDNFNMKETFQYWYFVDGYIDEVKITNFPIKINLENFYLETDENGNLIHLTTPEPSILILVINIILTDNRKIRLNLHKFAKEKYYTTKLTEKQKADKDPIISEAVCLLANLPKYDIKFVENIIKVNYKCSKCNNRGILMEINEEEPK